ncbi:putative transcriptional regulator, AsnC family [Acidovorax delafieldii 2AN]|uniref:siroheme decarboxylase n=1 Tax=Acidovorax delafieldii 2AN TaxID=573060 RepID=C5T6T1_ACIDE|nr:Lrp/AsnC family transcriptional regulator [Acidovorax delafieldii]EER59817.1 putative transcriptional regulator, AsnC family [Acidovorax delafieldii 2AN]
MDPHSLRLALLNPWQRDFPLVREPFARIAASLGIALDEVLAGYARLQDEGALSRIGGVFAGNAGGAALLAAMAVPPERIDTVAAIVSGHPGVNHNYQREHHYNLWFVMTGQDDTAVRAAMHSLEEATGLPALQLRMQRAYRIDLGFDLRERTAPAPMTAARDAAPVADADRPLAALLEDGLPLVPRPYDAWAGALQRTPESVLHTLQQWLDQGTVRRIGAIVRHHELGFDANAMTVFHVPEMQVDACGEALARVSGVTLAYRRERAEGWPYNLYCMVHGRDRAAVLDVIARAIADAGLGQYPHEVLFSCRRFKQTGPRRFRALPTATAPDAGATPEVLDAVAG